MFVFNGGTLTQDEVAGISIGDDEIAEWRFVDPGRPVIPLRPHIRRRIELAHRALSTGVTEYNERSPGS